MLFNSYEYIFLFLPLTFFIYFYLNSNRLTIVSKIFLVFASLFFYSWWNPVYLPIILVSMIFNFFIGRFLASNHSKSVLIFGLLGNIALLGYFKYVDFLIKNINTLFKTNIPLLKLALPLGISFFTFQQIAYIIDSYRKDAREYNFLNYALFVTFFPQLIAGPIVHHKEMMPQFSSRRNLIKNYKNIALGLLIFSIGLFKKVVIADTFSIWATAGFDYAENLNFFKAWATSLSYTFQLYFDFSGYTDMAIGTALLFNIKLPINFNSPYKALNIRDFWRRWHITLGRFLKDYIYIPLGGNRISKIRTYINLLITFLIAGLWHGASWMFVFWGFLHGLALVIHRIWNNLGFKMSKFLAWFLTFNFINFSWIFFRAKDWDNAIKVLKGMFGLSNIGNIKTLVHFGKITQFELFYLILVFFIAFISFFAKNSSTLTYKTIEKKEVYVVISILLWISILHLNKISKFLYFNF